MGFLVVFYNYVSININHIYLTLLYIIVDSGIIVLNNSRTVFIGFRVFIFIYILFIFYLYSIYILFIFYYSIYYI